MTNRIWRFGAEQGDVATVADLTQMHQDLRAQLVELCSAPLPDQKAIDAVIDRLAETQLVLKTASGLNFEDDLPYH